MKILINYSSDHFNPVGSAKYLDSGTGFLAKNIYETFCEIYPEAEVIYSDFRNYKKFTTADQIDYVFGLSNNFAPLVERVKPSQSVLFAVNRASKYRPLIALQKQIHQNCSPVSLDSADGIFSNPKDVLSATQVLQLGSWPNYLANRFAGVPDINQYLVGFYKGDLRTNITPINNPKRDIIMFMGSISFRKGIHVIPEVVEVIRNKFPEFRLVLYGRAVNKSVDEFIQSTISSSGGYLKHNSDFLEYESSHWNSIFQNAYLALAPAFEEGQQDAAMEVIRNKVPLLLSAECGIDSASELLIVESEDPLAWAGRVEELLSAKSSLIQRLIEEQTKLARAASPGISQIRRSLIRLQQSNGYSMWPTISAPREITENLPDNFVKIFLNSTADFHLEAISGSDKSTSLETMESAKNIDLVDRIQLGVMISDRYEKLKALQVGTIDIDSSHSANLRITKAECGISSLSTSDVPDSIFISVGEWTKFITTNQLRKSLFLSKLTRITNIAKRLIKH